MDTNYIIIEEKNVDFYDPGFAEDEIMYQRTGIENQRQHLRDRLSDTFRDKKTALRRHFHLEDDAPPKTPQQIVDRIKAGQYVSLKDREWEDRMSSSGVLRWCDPSPYAGIRWRDPKVVEDVEGFRAAEEVLDAARITVKDSIVVLSLEEGLKALREFEEKTFH